MPKTTTGEIVDKTSIQSIDNKVAPVAASNELFETHQESVKSSANEIYYAQATENGFQLVNSEPKIVMVLWPTAAENVFLAKGKSAIVFKENGFWYYSENDGTLGEKQQLTIKF